MTRHETPKAGPIDAASLDRLAELAVRVGLNLQPGQDLLLTAPIEALPLVRRIAEHAYKAGAGLVTPLFSDPEVALARYRFGADASFDRAAGWLYDGMGKAFEPYRQIAIENAIDGEMIASGMDDAELMSYGIENVGHRKKLLMKITKLQAA